MTKQIPYGVFPDFFWRTSGNTDLVMNDWMPDAPQNTRIKTYNAWQEQQLNKVTEFIWPRYDEGGKRWVGKADSKADSLTHHELKIIQKAYLMPDKLILDELPDCPTYHSNFTHKKLFDYEDSKKTKLFDADDRFKTWEVLFLYDIFSEKQKKFAAKVSDLSPIIKNKVEGFLWFKRQLQRPRPYQTAHHFSEFDFHVQPANTAMHASAPSGHTFVVCMMACAIYEAWLDQNLEISDSQLAALGYFAMDQGDRRVFAGVHYPSDNVVSWALAVNIIPHIYRHHEKIAQFLHTAITQQSNVYSLIEKHYRQNDVFKDLLEYLDNEVLGNGEPGPIA